MVAPKPNRSPSTKITPGKASPTSPSARRCWKRSKQKTQDFVSSWSDGVLEGWPDHLPNQHSNTPSLHLLRLFSASPNALACFDAFRRDQKSFADCLTSSASLDSVHI